jgi:hypothetical protein
MVAWLFPFFFTCMLRFVFDCPSELVKFKLLRYGCAVLQKRPEPRTDSTRRRQGPCRVLPDFVTVNVACPFD